MSLGEEGRRSVSLGAWSVDHLLGSGGNCREGRHWWTLIHPDSIWNKFKAVSYSHRECFLYNSLHPRKSKPWLVRCSSSPFSSLFPMRILHLLFVLEEDIEFRSGGEGYDIVAQSQPFQIHRKGLGCTVFLGEAPSQYFRPCSASAKSQNILSTPNETIRMRSIKKSFPPLSSLVGFILTEDDPG